MLYVFWRSIYCLNSPFRWFRKKPPKTSSRIPFPPLAGYEDDPNRNTTVTPYLEILHLDQDEDALSSEDVAHQGKKPHLCITLFSKIL